MDHNAKANSLLVPQAKQDTLFERGFKTWCENISVTIRKRLGVFPQSPLSAYDLALRLGVKVWKLENVPGLSIAALSHLSSVNGNEWSAVTISSNNQIIIIVNPTHSAARQSSDLMHELAHILKKHEDSQVFLSETGYALRSFNEKQEAEADWFAGTLLLPRTALSYCTYHNVPLTQILSDYAVSRDLYNYRLRKTGVKRQFGKR
jgi:Zn-dependent peptidase ImmA (M78 family)